MPYADRSETKPRYRAALFRLTCTVALIAMLVQIAPAQKLITPGYLFNSDPTCGQIGDTFYLFTTQDPFTVEFMRENAFYKGMYAFHEFTTTDFDHWVDHGSILTCSRCDLEYGRRVMGRRCRNPCQWQVLCIRAFSHEFRVRGELRPI